MSIFTCINEGSDGRKLRFIVCPLQNLLSWQSDREPRWLFVRRKAFDGKMYVSLGIAWPLYFVRQWFNDGIQKYRLFRIGWRYDANWHGYIFPTAANKKIDAPMEKGY